MLLFESDKNFIVIPCYNSSNIDIMALLNNKLIDRDLTMHKDAKDLIVASLGNDYGNTTSEIEKILNHHQSGDEISKSEVESIIVSSSNIIVTDLVDTVFEKKTESISRLYHSVLDEFNPAQILIITLNHVIKLMELLTEKDDLNIPNKQVIENTKPPIFFKRHPSLQRQLNTWNRGTLGDIIEILSVTTIDTRKNSDLSVELTERCLLKISSLKN